MEVSVIGNSQAKIATIDSACRENGFCNSNSGCLKFSRKNRICFQQNGRWRKLSTRLTLRAVHTEAVKPEKSLGSAAKPKSSDRMRLFVGLPLDAVSDCGQVNHARAIAAGLKALKLLGVEGVELPLWWGIVEKEAMGKFEWDGYLALAEMVEKAGLKLHVSLCFHASKQPKISLPNWVSQIGESQPDIFFTDHSGQRYKECLSLAVDNLPVLNGKTPLEVYGDFCDSFKSTFSGFLGSTITGISVGLGPDGELRYPSQQMSKDSKVPGVGEFQCYDANILNLLKQHAEATGNPLWGLGGPHDVPSYDQPPHLNNFFKDDGGSWESTYGEFFLSWYSNELVSHGNRMLSVASSTFSDSAVELYGKLPLVHSWYRTCSHPSELTAGFYNTQTRDGYDAIAEMFAKNSIKMILPGMDLSDENQAPESLSSPESLLAQIKAACRKHGVEISGQNSAVSGTPGGFEQIKKSFSDEDTMNLFTYQRMGADFFSPEHFPSFTAFVRSLDEPELGLDDQPIEDKEAVHSHSVKQMQAA